LLTIDEDGRAILTNFLRRISTYHFSFKSAVSALSFSPSGRHFAVGVGRFVEVWHTPSTPDATSDGGLEFAPFVLHRRLAGHFDTIQSVHWSSDSRFFLTSSKDLTARIWSLDPEEGFEPTTLAGHKEGVKNAWFSKDQETVCASKNIWYQLLIEIVDIYGIPRWCFVSMAICQEDLARRDE
jgi:periodic tryptophan protein 2